jgi:cytochrome c oxidase subunit IV
MRNPVIAALYLAGMVVVIVGVDVAFFRHHLWERLAANVGIVLVFAAFYLRFTGRPWPPWK